jgi:hypothetical protein
VRVAGGPRRKFRKAEHQVAAERKAWAKMVRAYGISAVARQLKIRPQAVLRRVQRIERGKG